MRPVDLVGIQLEPTTGAPVLILREHDEPHRLLPIFVGGAEAASIAVAVTGQPLPRPLTHDLMASLVQGLDGRLDAAEVTALRDGAFVARLSISGPSGSTHIDTRPSDAIALAVRLHAPLYVSDEVLDEAGAVPDDDDQADDGADDRDGADGALVDDATIDEEVARFRDFLGEIDPADFDATLDTARDAEVIEDDDGE